MKYVVPRQIKPGILKLTIKRCQNNFSIAFIFATFEVKGCYAPVNVNPRTPRPGHSGAFDKHSLLKLQNAPHPKVRFFL